MGTSCAQEARLGSQPPSSYRYTTPSQAQQRSATTPPTRASTSVSPAHPNHGNSVPPAHATITKNPLRVRRRRQNIQATAVPVQPPPPPPPELSGSSFKQRWRRMKYQMRQKFRNWDSDDMAGKMEVIGWVVINGMMIMICVLMFASLIVLI